MEEKKHTPMIQQYLNVKKNYPDTIVLYRLGDFYELFFEDAKLASKLLDLVLTARGKNENAVPMCGMPHHSASSHIQKLVSAGYKVAIVEQLEEASAGKIVERDVIKIITPGTILDEEDVKSSHYLVSIYDTKFSFVLVYCDHYNGDLFTKIIKREEALLQETLMNNVKEVVIHKNFEFKKVLKNISFSFVPTELDMSEYKYLNPYTDLGISEAFKMMMQYLMYTQKTQISHLNPLYLLNEKEYLVMDFATKRNLELITSTKSKKYSLWGFLDRCKTAMGSRLLQKWVEYPLIDIDKITYRQNIIEILKDNLLLQTQLKQELEYIYDIKRLLVKISYHNISPKDLLKLKTTLIHVPTILNLMQEAQNLKDVDPCQEVLVELEKALLENPATFIREGNVFKDEYNEELAKYRKLQTEGNSYILDLEAKERERTQIKNLKIGYTRVFGYYIEVTKGQKENVKEEFGYERRQTLANAERYISKELKEIESQLLHAKEKAIALEEKLYENLLNYLNTFHAKLSKLADVLSEIDCYYALSQISSSYGYTKPKFGTFTKIEEGRHPILETLMQQQQYISNDFSTEEDNFMILTGPNMGGKSTYMRQVALIIIMAQIGCFVPAQSAQIQLYTQIFTRMGASDDILSAQSTFMVEMSEANHALRNADANSLILFDEIGRGTSTYDGMSLAWAMIEYISQYINATTIFSTHYHELIQLAGKNKIYNSYVEVHEENDHVTFLYKVKKGYINKSYGINVASLAKLPEPVIERSKEILTTLQKDVPEIKTTIPPKVIEKSPVEELIKNANVDKMSPLEALLFVVQLKEEVNK